MTNLTDRTDKYYVAKVSKHNQAVEFINISEISGAINFRTDMKSGHFEDATIASQVANHLNGIYEKMGTEIYCYRVNSAESNSHIISNAPEEYKSIIRAFYGQAEEESEEEAEEDTEGA